MGVRWDVYWVWGLSKSREAIMSAVVLSMREGFRVRVGLGFGNLILEGNCECPQTNSEGTDDQMEIGMDFAMWLDNLGVELFFFFCV